VTSTDQALLIDTSAFLFWHSDSRRLSKRARAALLDALHRPVYVSAVTAFEIATKVRLGKLAVPSVLLNEFAYVVESDGFRVLELNSGSAVRAGLLPDEHRDPFDRLLAAQALVHHCAVVTPDRLFSDSLGTEVLW
jgi:PIN domain nuclease of toxin-antitoxin system